MLRKTGIVITLMSLLVGGAVVTLYLYAMTQHARADSEVGTFVYGMAMLIYLTAMMLGIFIGSLLWWVGLRNIRESTQISTLEVVLQKLFIVPSGLWIGFAVFRLVAHYV